MVGRRRGSKNYFNMQIKFIDNEINYDGSQLRSHFLYETCDLKGDAIASFIGGADVNLSHMVDKEDVAAKSPIFSEKMLHFIVEHFDHDLEKTVLRQRLLMVLMQEELVESLPEEKIIRRGDDLFCRDGKLTVSIATLSPVSTLIHSGINIISRNTPVPTCGLEDLGLSPKAFAWAVMNRYIEEIREINWARCKVRGVS